MSDKMTNPFTNTMGKYQQYPDTTLGQATGTFQSIKNFLESDNIDVKHATIKYTSCIKFISSILFQDSPTKNGKNMFEEMNGNLKFDYLGSDSEFKELFAKYNLEYN
jgi:hypothetical protein